jgi:hypothetical protein
MGKGNGNIARMKSILAKPLESLTQEDREFLVRFQGWLSDEEKEKYNGVLTGKSCPEVMDLPPSVVAREKRELKKKGGK